MAGACAQSPSHCESSAPTCGVLPARIADHSAVKRERSRRCDGPSVAEAAIGTHGDAAAAWPFDTGQKDTFSPSGADAFSFFFSPVYT